MSDEQPQDEIVEKSVIVANWYLSWIIRHNKDIEVQLSKKKFERQNWNSRHR